MTTPSRKLPQGPTPALVPLKAYLPIPLWHEAMDRAEKAGLSASRYVALLISRDEVDGTGRPVWAPQAAPQGQLPLAG